MYRKPGMYWVNTGHSHRRPRWEIGYWSGQTWQLFNCPSQGTDEEFEFTAIGQRVVHPGDEVMSDEELNVLADLDRKAWEGPWNVQQRPIWRGDGPDLPGTYAAVVDSSFVIANFQPVVSNDENAAFVAAFRNAAPKLLQTINVLKARVKELEAADRRDDVLGITEHVTDDVRWFGARGWGPTFQDFTQWVRSKTLAATRADYPVHYVSFADPADVAELRDRYGAFIHEPFPDVPPTA